MNWDDLKIFLAVARCGTMSGAAKQLNVQHSTVSRRVRALEKQLDINLLSRSKGSYQLTSAGNKIMRAAARIENEVFGVDNALMSNEALLAGPLRITTNNSMASSIFMRLFDSFCKAYPQIDLHIIASAGVVSLAHREADVAIRWTNSPPESLIGKRITTVASTIYGSAQYIKQHQQEKGTLKWIGAECCSFHRDWTRQSCNHKSFQFNCDDALMIHSAVREGMGVSYLPCFIGDSDPLLERYCPPNQKFDLGLWLLIHPDSRHNSRIVAFRNHIIQNIDEQLHLFEGRC